MLLQIPKRLSHPLNHIDYVNSNLAMGHYFFKDIANEGILLYDSKRFHLAEPRKLTPAEYKKQSEEIRLLDVTLMRKAISHYGF